MEGLTDGEYLVLAPLEAGEPRPLFEIADDFVRCVVGTLPTIEQIAAVLGPGAVSMAAHRLIEVRRFQFWPMPWPDGVPTTPADLGTAAIWSEHDGDCLVARITEAGLRWL
ncbi:hypothetical protein GCM10010172_70870 [Paractinoplanes ferrugineus]|uniref:Uncharacterized protein n=1 Tax=Paractinoplanes ferrugineus TaxID=113564 RepID=A0A919MP61_9ACTN|nr:hypothetical protein [Actinoplanes ferrugineus]GIE14972.1 hypothetical protein Afe05nite_68120 [Actinoplanes ferrugineus]